MKYLFLLPPVIVFYIIRDMAILLKHQDLLRGISLLILLSLLGIFFCAWLDSVKRINRIIRKVGFKAYSWLEAEDE